MKYKSFVGIFLFILIVFVSLNCSSHGTSNVTIHINLGLNQESAVNTFENSIFDRIFRLFTKDAEAQIVPPNLTSIILNISGSGMETISNTYPSSTTSIELEVPSGPSRLFEVLADTGSATLRGAVTQSLVGGTTVTIPITMGLYQTRIVIPDYNYGSSSSRLVQVDNLAGNGWVTRNATQLNLSSIAISFLCPYDIDFDLWGRIYIANFHSSTESAIIRIDNINDTIPEKIPSLGVNISSLAIDRTNNILYYTANSSQIYRVRIDITNDTPVNLNLQGSELDGNNNFNGLFFENNCLYVVNRLGLSVKKLDLTRTPGNRVVAISNAVFSTPTDVIIKSPYIYVLDFGNLRIIRLDENLQYIDHITTAPGGTPSFVGPQRFLAILNPRFYLIDEDNSGSINRIIGFNDFSSNWDVYTGDSNFHFYIC